MRKLTIVITILALLIGCNHKESIESTESVNANKKDDIYMSIKENEIVVDKQIDKDVIQLIDEYINAINQKDLEVLKKCMLMLI
ncbi:hypothetical protein [Chengkuizengella axinellae]|uniref:Lipoprotein n=1 Tax=Chengkuizengella axinellae TaxID=3064388 RepID=A0ABT9IU28_9BACL|nr:hypothetical protein [Chengkuizengella sp. 2205SS18-9]MDP5272854.1 hypothetical protein [Chengkuizengella sp. 2205SS18-9]